MKTIKFTEAEARVITSYSIHYTKLYDSKAANIFPVNNDFPLRASLVFSAEKYDLMIPTIKIIRINKRKTLGTSKIKKRKVSVKCFPCSNLKTLSIIKFVISARYL